MRFILGIIVTLVVLACAGLVLAFYGLVDVRADQTPSQLEKSLAGKAMDASLDRHAPSLRRSIEPNDANLREGMSLYRDKCAQCHGDPQTPESKLTEYPPAPQFMTDHADMPENQNVYIIKHGVRWTAMPGWEGLLSDDQILKVTAFLSHMQQLPAAVDHEWKTASPRTGP